jgi:Casein kinase substrate phosphoprotein PP28/SAP domain
MRRHLAGETEEAQRDMARLALVRQRREAERLKREAEGRAPGMSQFGLPEDSEDSDEDSDEEGGGASKPKVAKAPKPVAEAPKPLSEIAAKKKAAAAAVDEPVVTASGLPPKEKPMDIKKMNGDALKEALKARGLDIQGQKKDLTKRLLDFEAARTD